MGLGTQRTQGQEVLTISRLEAESLETSSPRANKTTMKAANREALELALVHLVRIAS